MVYRLVPVVVVARGVGPTKKKRSKIENFILTPVVAIRLWCTFVVQKRRLGPKMVTALKISDFWPCVPVFWAVYLIFWACVGQKPV